MDELEDLAGRIDGVARAVMHMAATLEIAGLMDGPRLSQALRQSVAPAAVGALQTSRRVLLEMAERLDDARQARLSCAHT